MYISRLRVSSHWHVLRWRRTALHCWFLFRLRTLRGCKTLAVGRVDGGSGLPSIHNCPNLGMRRSSIPSVMLCYFMLCYIVLRYVMLRYVMLCHVTLCYVMLWYVMSCHAMSCHAMSCHVMSCHAMLCYAMLCYVMLCYVTYVFMYVCMYVCMYVGMYVCMHVCMHTHRYVCSMYAGSGQDR